jgi:purine-nucleoside phosphorylase
MKINLSLKYSELIKFFENEHLPAPDIAIILGSGLGDFANRFQSKKVYRTSELPGYPPSTIIGHEGKIHFVEYYGKNILLFQGRIHFYEGYKISECVLPAFIANSLNGIFIKKELTQLIGLSTPETKNFILTLEENSLTKVIKKSAESNGINLKTGTYIYAKGPSYETPAEIQFFKKFGSDAVGMSTVHEAVFSAYLGMETAVISCITNYAAGISDKKLSHSDVTETAELVKEKFSNLLETVIKQY